MLASAQSSPRRVLAARVLALVADGVQWGLLPLFAEGVGSPLDAALDVVLCGVMTLLLGWSWLFLPTALAEGVPFVDLAPTWTAAVFLVTRQAGQPALRQPPLAEKGLG